MEITEITPWLKRALYIWNKLLNSTLKKLGFNQCNKDTCVYLYHMGKIFAILAVHVDDMLIISNSKPKLVENKLELAKHFRVKDLGELGKLPSWDKVTWNRQTGIIELLQQVYIEQLLKQFNLQDVKLATTPLSPGTHLTQDDCLSTDEEKDDMANIPYASLVGALMYAAIRTRPNITFAVGALSRFLSNPGRHHWNEAKHIFSYLQQRVPLVMQLYRYHSQESSVGRVIGYSHGVAIQLSGVTLRVSQIQIGLDVWTLDDQPLDSCG